MKEISKVDTRLGRTVHGLGTILFGAPFAAIGGYFALAGFGFIPLAGKANAPLWVLGTIGLSFFAVGLMLAVWGLSGWWRKRRMAARGVTHQAWLEDYPWERDGISDNPHPRWLKRLGMLVFLGLFMTPFNWWAWLSGDGGLFLRILITLFDLILVAVLVEFLYRLLQALKFGASRLHFRQFPYRPASILRVGFSPNAFDRLKVTLRYIEERYETRGKGRNRSSRHICYERWSEVQELEPSEQMREVEIEFQLPDQPEWVTRLSADPGIVYWELLLESEVPGINYRATFPLPVYAG